MKTLQETRNELNKWWWGCSANKCRPNNFRGDAVIPPTPFPVDAMKALIGNSSSTLADLNIALSKTMAAIAEFQRQVDVHVAAHHQDDVDIASAWRDDAIGISTLLRAAITEKQGGGSGGGGGGMSKTMKWVIGGSIGAALLITGIILIVKLKK